MDTVYYCGFNGFRQVPVSSSSHTLTSLVAHLAKGRTVIDVAICWNYLVIASEQDGIVKYGLVNGKNGSQKLEDPPGGGKVTQLSATPRHLLVCTDKGECWTHEEAKGWRRVTFDLGEVKPEDSQTKDDNKDETEESNTEDDDKESEESRSPPMLVKTSCGDAHNLGLDSDGRAYSLPSPLDFDMFPKSPRHKVTDVVCGKEHCLLLTEHGQVYSWGGGSRGQLGHGSLNSEEKPKLISALDGLRITKIAAGGWHSAVISQFDDLYMFGWNESGQLAQTTNLVKPAECFAAVEKLLMACCTMQPEDSANPRGDAEDCEVYHKNDDAENASSRGLSPNDLSSIEDDLEKDALTCYNAATSCNEPNTDHVVVQSLPMHILIPGQEKGGKALDVACGSRHTIVLTEGNQLWGFGWNKYGQLGLGHTLSRDVVEKIPFPKGKNGKVKMLRCGDWGTALVMTKKNT